MLLWAFLYTFLCGHMVSFLLAVYLEWNCWVMRWLFMSPASSLAFSDPGVLMGKDLPCPLPRVWGSSPPFHFPGLSVRCCGWEGQRILNSCSTIGLLGYVEWAVWHLCTFVSSVGKWDDPLYGLFWTLAEMTKAQLYVHSLNVFIADGRASRCSQQMRRTSPSPAVSCSHA